MTGGASKTEGLPTGGSTLSGEAAAEEAEAEEAEAEEAAEEAAGEAAAPLGFFGGAATTGEDGCLLLSTVAL